jgi:hypothetical protein
MKPSVEFIEVGGFAAAIKGMRYPTKTEGDSVKLKNGEFVLGEKDKRLAINLLNKTETDWNEEDIFQGDTHGKFQRSIIAWFDINMPRYIWSELDTYTIGMTPVSSESTMYTLKKEVKNVDDINKDMFIDSTPDITIEGFRQIISFLINEYGEIKNIPLDVIKCVLPEGWMQKRVRSYSYQTLRRIYLQRKHHRLPEWQIFCDAIEQLPYADELVFGKK